MAGQGSGAAKSPPTTERKIYFYRVNAGRRPSGKPVSVDFAELLTQLNALPCAAGGRYWEQADGNVVCGWPDPHSQHQTMRLATIRRMGLPLLEEAGNLAPLNVPATTGLYEAIHLVFLPNGIVGVEFNFYGPRPSRLPAYLRRVIGNHCPSFSLDPLLRQDVQAQLRHMRQIRLFDLKVRTSYESAIRQADQSLGAAIQACRNVGQPEVVHIALQPEPYSRGFLQSPIVQATRRLARRRDLRENTMSFSVRGAVDDRGIETIDVLRDELVAVKRVVRLDQRSRAIDDSAAYGAIMEAHREMRDDLEAAAAVES